MKVLVTTSGVGTRLGEHTRYTNKSLVQVGDKPALARIIDSYPADYEFVVTLGYHGDLVAQFLEIAYPERSFHLVAVDPYQGPGSSLAYSMLCARDLLQEPFIYNAGDTLWSSPEIRLSSGNWLGGFRGGDATLYASFDTVGNRISKLHPKGMDHSDYLYVGLARLQSYGSFWQTLERLEESAPFVSDLTDFSAISVMVEEGDVFEVEPVEEWHDVGSIAGLEIARKQFSPTLPTLEKRDEAIFFLDNHVVKFFSDEHVCAARVERSSILAPFVPPVTRATKNWYAYPFVEGRVLGERVTPGSFRSLLDWALESFWSRELGAFSESDFRANCEDFYFSKTRKRIAAFVNQSGLGDGETLINGLVVPSAHHLLLLVEELGLLSGRPGLVHGDFILDNVLETEHGFLAIDWRQGFGDLLSYGDVYYDLAKLNHSLTMNHGELFQGHFDVSFEGDGVWVDILRKSSLVHCAEVLADFANAEGYDLTQIQIITSLIWINMAPLHPHPMDTFLFFYGRYSLWSTLLARGLVSDSQRP